MSEFIVDCLLIFVLNSCLVEPILLYLCWCQNLYNKMGVAINLSTTQCTVCDALSSLVVFYSKQLLSAGHTSTIHGQVTDEGSGISDR